MDFREEDFAGGSGDLDPSWDEFMKDMESHDPFLARGEGGLVGSIVSTKNSPVSPYRRGRLFQNRLPLGENRALGKPRTISSQKENICNTGNLVTPPVVNCDKLQKVDKKQKRRRASTGLLRHKYDTALDQISNLELDKEKLQNEISKLKLSLALAESEYIALSEPNLLKQEEENYLSPTVGEVAASPDVQKNVPWRSSVKPQDRTQGTQSGAAVGSLTTQSPRFAALGKKKKNDADLSVWRSQMSTLLFSESFHQVGTGESVLDTLSHQCRRDVVLRYCDILDSLSNAKDK